MGGAAAGLALGGCGGGSGSEVLTVTGWSDATGDFQDLLSRFTEETGIRARYLEAPAAYPDLVAKYITYLQSGYDEIDVYLTDDFTVGVFQQAGWLVDLKPHTSESERAAFAPQVQEYFRRTGVYRLPIFLGGGALYYRKDILDKEGMKPPATWDELISMGKELKAKYPDKWPWAPMASREDQDVNYVFQTILQGGGDPKVLNDDGCVAAFQHMHDIIFKHKITPPAVATYTVDQTSAFVKEGDHLMWWFFEDGVAEFTGDQYDFVPWPAGPGGARKGMVHAWGWAISEYSKRKEQALEFVKFATEDRQLEDFMVGGLGLTPPKTRLQKDPKIQNELPFIDYILEQDENLEFRLIDVVNALEVNNTIGKTGSYVLTGEKSPEEAANWGHDQMQRIFEYYEAKGSS
jgi:ABC-type glycerol-3-phosphate transport system substrate-binding protein